MNQSYESSYKRYMQMKDSMDKLIKSVEYVELRAAAYDNDEKVSTSGVEEVNQVDCSSISDQETPSTSGSSELASTSQLTEQDSTQPGTAKRQAKRNCVQRKSERLKKERYGSDVIYYKHGISLRRSLRIATKADSCRKADREMDKCKESKSELPVEIKKAKVTAEQKKMEVFKRVFCPSGWRSNMEQENVPEINANAGLKKGVIKRKGLGKSGECAIEKNNEREAEEHVKGYNGTENIDDN